MEMSTNLKLIQKVSKEKDTLDAKMESLRTLLNDSPNKNLPPDYVSLLNAQFFAMSVYSSVLADQIELLNKKQ